MHGSVHLVVIIADRNAWKRARAPLPCSDPCVQCPSSHALRPGAPAGSDTTAATVVDIPRPGHQPPQGQAAERLTIHLGPCTETIKAWRAAATTRGRYSRTAAGRQVSRYRDPSGNNLILSLLLFFFTAQYWAQYTPTNLLCYYYLHTGLKHSDTFIIYCNVITIYSIILYYISIAYIIIITRAVQNVAFCVLLS